VYVSFVLHIEENAQKGMPKNRAKIHIRIKERLSSHNRGRWAIEEGTKKKKRWQSARNHEKNNRFPNHV